MNTQIDGTGHRRADRRTIPIDDGMPHDSRGSEAPAHPRLFVVERGSTGVVGHEVGDLAADQRHFAVDGDVGGVGARRRLARSELEGAVHADRSALCLHDERAGAPTRAVGPGPDVGLVTCCLGDSTFFANPGSSSGTTRVVTRVTEPSSPSSRRTSSTSLWPIASYFDFTASKSISAAKTWSAGC